VAIFLYSKHIRWVGTGFKPVPTGDDGIMVENLINRLSKCGDGVFFGE